jgi:hypothetical protein
VAGTTVGASSSRAYCDYGHHADNTFDFNLTSATRGAYARVRQYVRLNTIDAATASPRPDGVYALWINEQLVSHAPAVVYRQKVCGARAVQCAMAPAIAMEA